MSGEIKVGQELAFVRGERIVLRKVDRITPSGRFVCGPFTLNPDLTVRGDDSWTSVTVSVVTDEIRAKYDRNRLIQVIEFSITGRGKILTKLDTQTLKEIWNLMNPKKKEE